MSSSDGNWWYHTGSVSPLAYDDARSGWVHLGTRAAAESRRQFGDRALYRVRICPVSPVGWGCPVEDYDANRLDYWFGWGQPRDVEGLTTVDRAVRFCEGTYVWM